ncbi:hypothetical protein V8C35DRAFT_287690 [Trichoderma chlorosporum]
MPRSMSRSYMTKTAPPRASSYTYGQFRSLACCCSCSCCETTVKPLPDAHWPSVQPRQLHGCFGQPRLTSGSNGGHFPSNLQQRASDARRDPRWASYIRSREPGTALASASTDPSIDTALPRTKLEILPEA